MTSPSNYEQIFVHDLRGAAIREELITLFAVNPYVPGGVDAQRETDFRAGSMRVIDHIERKIIQAREVVEPNNLGEDESNG